MDFTIYTYKKLLNALQNAGYNFQTFAEFIREPKEKSVMLRHDVDKRPRNSEEFAKIQKSLGIKGTYYFRCVPESYDEQIIRNISEMNHEVGYHYEEMDLCHGNLDSALKLFEKNITKLRELCPIESICMQGSPRSKYDNKSLWNSNKYSDYQVVGEPYLDLNFNKIGYLTDTGRTWNGARFSVRDKVDSKLEFNIASTQEFIGALNENRLPNQLMLTFHPQRWTSNKTAWFQELLVQNLKNVVKKILVRRN